ncbi:hypothetical protein [Bacillus massiliigorillae]|uniref:hypothetical protein n=1 Tax=Bacillus massiliigorillae TaxID=1243664 RepID=UPI0003A2D0EB|nr:hypothetical protein [Bacillus massiliigorillae]
MDIKETVKSIVIEVLQAMKEEERQRCKGKVLFIFCDSSAHEPFSDQFIELRKANIVYDCLFLDGETSSWLGLHKVECSGANRVLATDEFAPAPIDLVKDYDGIIIPEIDLENAARLVLGIKGTIKSEIIHYALIANKFVLVGEALPGLKRSERKCLQTVKLPPYYDKLFQDYLRNFTALGIDLLPQQSFAKNTIERLTDVKEDTLESASGMDSVQVDFEGKLLSAEWVSLQGNDLSEKITLSKGTIVSPLAYDLLNEKGIAVHFNN